MLKHIPVASALLFASTVSAHAGATIFSFSDACEPSTCTTDQRFGDPATSSVSRGAQFLPPDGGGYNYSAQAAATGLFRSFSLYGHVGGNTFSETSLHDLNVGQHGMSATAQVQYHDEVNVAGSGHGTILVPWHVTGSFDFGSSGPGTGRPSAVFGVSFCQSIVTGNNSGGLGCTGGDDQFFNASGAYDTILNLVYQIELGVTYSLNTTFSLSAGAGGNFASFAEADLSHTGLLQPASVYDTNGNLLPDAVITAASGLDYRSPQAIDPGPVVGVPEPASLSLFGAGLFGLGWLRRRRAR